MQKLHYKQATILTTNSVPIDQRKRPATTTISRAPMASGGTGDALLAAREGGEGPTATLGARKPLVRPSL